MLDLLVHILIVCFSMKSLNLWVCEVVLSIRGVEDIGSSFDLC